MDAALLFIVIVLFLATLVRSALGFGEALIAVPLLSLVMPVETAVPLAVLVSVTIAVVVVAQDWRHVHVRSAALLVGATLLGVPLGLWMLVAAPEAAVKGVMALVIVAFAVYSLTHPRRIALKDDRYAGWFGFAAGALGGAYGMNGPPLVMYGAARRWTPEQFRATLQGYFLPASAVGMVGYWLAGLWTMRVTRWYLFAAPAVLIAILLGRALNRRLNQRAFEIAINIGLIVVAALLVTQTM